jgi:hypothetical protein
LFVWCGLFGWDGFCAAGGLGLRKRLEIERERGPALAREFDHVSPSVGLILWLFWDPIGLNDNQNLKHEYESFEAKVVAMVRSTKTIDQIDDFLKSLEVEILGKETHPDQRRVAATKLVALRLGPIDF